VTPAALRASSGSVIHVAGADFAAATRGLDPAATRFVSASKSFTTIAPNA